jgi:uncharacterized protein (TIGR04255 family)
MAIHEVFPNPTVKQVIFQVRFPNLFSMESLVGEYQRRIMARFPQAKLVFRRQLLIGHDMSDSSVERQEGEVADIEAAEKIWAFSSPAGVRLNLRTGSLDMASTSHKTYANPSHENRFRDVIEFVIANFLEVTHIPLFTRIGLRYIDECPVPERHSGRFREYYNTALCLDRFPLEDATEFQFLARVARGGYFLTFRESLKDIPDQAKLVLDFDGYALNVATSDYLPVVDRLHGIILAEFETSIKQPVYDHMRRAPEVGDGTP